MKQLSVVNLDLTHPWYKRLHKYKYISAYQKHTGKVQNFSYLKSSFDYYYLKALSIYLKICF